MKRGGGEGDLGVAGLHVESDGVLIKGEKADENLEGLEENMCEGAVKSADGSLITTVQTI